MTSILKIRERIVSLYKNNETITLFILKLATGLLMFTNINGVGYYREELRGFFTLAGGFPFVLIFSALFAAAPPVVGHLLVLLAIMGQISLSLELTLMVFLIGVCILVFYCRLEPQKSYIITAMIIASFFNLHYAVVLLAGLYIGFAAIIPVAVGTAVWSFLPVFSGLAETSSPTQALIEGAETIDVTQITDAFTNIYTTINNEATGNLQWVFSVFIFAMVIILVYAVSRLTVSYAKELALGLGGLLCIFGSIMAGNVGGGEANILLIIVFTIISVGIAMLIRFFDIALDYKKVEYVEFEDDEGYYYVKIIHKLGTSPISSRGIEKSIDKKRPVPKKAPRHSKDRYADDPDEWPYDDDSYDARPARSIPAKRKTVSGKTVTDRTVTDREAAAARDSVRRSAGRMLPRDTDADEYGLPPRRRSSGVSSDGRLTDRRPGSVSDPKPAAGTRRKFIDDEDDY